MGFYDSYTELAFEQSLAAMDKRRYCAKCNDLVEYTEQDWEDKGEKGWKQFCKVCGTCVGMRHDLSNLPLKGHADPYAQRDSYLRHRYYDKWR